jgi:FkbM family methyltransferase
MRWLKTDFAEVGGLKFHLDSKDSMELSLMQYDPFESELICSRVSEGDTVLDLGGNIGYYANMLARKVGREGAVYTFEPEPENYALLCRNVAENKFTWITAVNAAVAESSGFITLWRSPDNAGDHRIFEPDASWASIKVKSVCLDEYFVDNCPSFTLIKMDIQGAEIHALRGMKRLLANSPNVRIAIEFWPLGLHRAGWSGNDLINLLEDYGFDLYEIDERRKVLAPLDRESLLKRCTAENRQFRNLLCARRGQKP